MMNSVKANAHGGNNKTETLRGLLFAGSYLRLWFFSVIYFLILSLSFTYIFQPGFVMVFYRGGAVSGAGLIISAFAIAVILTAIYIAIVPGKYLAERAGNPHTLIDVLKRIPGLALVFLCAAIVFAVLSGLFALLFYYVIFSGISETARRTPILLAALALAVLSAPFFFRAFTCFSFGLEKIGELFKKTLRMGRARYAKLLAISAIAFGLAYLIRAVIPGEGTFSQIAILLLTSLVFSAALVFVFRVHKAIETESLPEYRRNIS